MNIDQEIKTTSNCCLSLVDFIVSDGVKFLRAERQHKVIYKNCAVFQISLQKESLLWADQSFSASLDCREKLLTMCKLTRLQIANLHRQLQRWDVICSHNPLGTAATSVLHTESCDRRAAIGSRNPGDVRWTFSRHGDGRTIRSLWNWWKKQIGIKLIPVITASEFMQTWSREKKKSKERTSQGSHRGMYTYGLAS